MTWFKLIITMRSTAPALLAIAYAALFSTQNYFSGNRSVYAGNVESPRGLRKKIQAAELGLDFACPESTFLV